MNNPIVKNLKNFSLYILFWILVIVLVQSFLIWALSIPFNDALKDNLVFNLLLLVVCLSFWYSAQYISFEHNSLSKIVLNHVVGAVIISVLWLAAGYFILFHIITQPLYYEEFFIKTISWRLLLGIIFYFLFTSFYYVVIYYTNYQERAIREVELKNLVTQAELKSLKFQINPHFIFNSLNSMSALTVINPEKARSMILKLADFLRYTLASNEKQTTSLDEELKNIRLYLEIEKIRFEDKFDFKEDIEDECLRVKVPSMILQPLFENSIKHAVYEALEKVTLNLSAKMKNGFMEIKVENNFDGEQPIKSGTGIGLTNIRNRLELIYNQRDLINIKKEKKLFSVNIYIPV